MYKCDKHGKLKTEWCDKCQKIFKCDCSDITTNRVKDVHYSYGEDFSEGCVTIYVRCCNTCGKVVDITF